MCGEQAIYVCRWVRDEGSPPRVRGTGASCSPGVRSRRITPACAGNRYTLIKKRFLIWDHPRVCGEQRRFARIKIYGIGSPPRVRGTEKRVRKGEQKWRITPACAGNSLSVMLPPPALGDHPRVCGEQFGRKSWMSSAYGSPPRVRGTVHGGPRGREGWRITPACAGKRSCGGCELGRIADHPRVCGEQAPCWPPARPSRGSPPRVRGTAKLNASATIARGITPACAGNSQTIHLLQIRQKDHPRVCGEQ